MEVILKFLFKPGYYLHAVYILFTGQVHKSSDGSYVHMNQWIVSTMFWALVLFGACWMVVTGIV
ncbi:hypothetical protein [Gynuella sp.]|uniref:hypothetical protein n=1 Tax=Gynuella sp. TaxID=2969146 RepID=UPI003D10D388